MLWLLYFSDNFPNESLDIVDYIPSLELNLNHALINYEYFFRWWTSNTIAVVTGANRGIGFEIAHQLALHGLTVILTSRETGVGEEAAKVLQEGGLNVVFHPLDILDPSSIEAFAIWIKEVYGGIEILVEWPLPYTSASNYFLGLNK